MKIRLAQDNIIWHAQSRVIFVLLMSCLQSARVFSVSDTLLHDTFQTLNTAHWTVFEGPGKVTHEKGKVVMRLKQAQPSSALGITYKPKLNLKGKKTTIEFAMWLGKGGLQYLEFDLGNFTSQMHEEPSGFWHWIISYTPSINSSQRAYGSPDFYCDLVTVAPTHTIDAYQKNYYSVVLSERPGNNPKNEYAMKITIRDAGRKKVLFSEEGKIQFGAWDNGSNVHPDQVTIGFLTQVFGGLNDAETFVADVSIIQEVIGDTTLPKKIARIPDQLWREAAKLPKEVHPRNIFVAANINDLKARLSAEPYSLWWDKVKEGRRRRKRNPKRHNRP